MPHRLSRFLSSIQGRLSALIVVVVACSVFAGVLVDELGLTGGPASSLSDATALALVLIALFVPLGLALVRPVAVQLERIIAAARRASDGNLDIEAMLPSADGEIGQLSRILGRLAARLRGDMDEIRRLAFTDSVTGLNNRAHFHNVFGKVMRHPFAANVPRALMFVDIDHFKQVNDVYGHSYGDALLGLVAGKLLDACREAGFPPEEPTTPWRELPAERRLALVARQAGDEFVLLLRNHAGTDELTRLAADICRRICFALDVDGRVLQLSASVGIVDMRIGASEPSELMRFADLAMYEAKRNGRNGYAFFTPELDVRARDRLILEMELRKAVGLREFEVHYMAVMPLAGGACTKAEALVRWRHPRLGLLAPDAFMAVAEESGLVVQIDKLVLDDACRQAAAWARDGRAVTVAVNVSPSDIRRPDFVQSACAILARHDTPPSLVEMEVTETVAMANAGEIAAAMTELRALGIRFAIDDFGTGHSNLATLAALPFDLLKIDRTFIDPLRTAGTGNGATIVDAVLGLAGNLGMSVVAEGVETSEQAAYLRRRGCAMGQGLYFGQALPAAAFEQLFLKPVPVAAELAGR